MTGGRGARALLARSKLALWFAGLALLGYLRFWMKVVREQHALDAVAWMWLAGSVLMTLVAVVLFMRELRRP